METNTILLIVSSSIALIFCISFLVSLSRNKKSEKSLMDRIIASDTAKIQCDKTIKNLHKESEFLNDRINTIDKQLNQEQKKSEYLEKSIDSLNKTINEKIVEILALKEELRVTKGKATRYKNRDTKNSKVLNAMLEKMKGLGYKFGGFEIQKVEDGEKSVPIFTAIHVKELCDCVLPNEGVGNHCTKCKKPVR